MTVSKDEIKHVARLARLDLPEEDLALFVEQIGEILGYVNKLNQLDTESTPPMSHAVSLVNAFQKPGTGGRPEKPESLSNAPAAEDGFFRVPKVIE